MIFHWKKCIQALIVTASLLAFAGGGYAQSGAYQFSSGIYTGTAGELPFWLHSNVSGKVDPSGANLLNQVSFTQPIIEKESFSIQAGGNGVFRWSNNSSVYFSELYLRARGYGLQVDAGRFRQPVGLNNHDLSVGSMMVSRNAVPVPKISIATPQFVDVPYTKGYVQYKGMFSHGWLESDRYVESPYLHQKYLYLRINIGRWSGTGGIVHNAQWGGEHPQSGRLPQGFYDYLRLISGMPASGDNAPGVDIVNVIGNSVAAYEFGLNYEQEAFEVSLTRLFYLEDKVSMRFRSPWDGVWGANFRFKGKDRWLSAITYEHINTKNQDAKSWELIGRRDYYDNFLYRSGWTYEGRVLGLPLISYDRTTITNNVLVGHHLGFEGNLYRNLGYRALFTYSRNYGVQDDWVSSTDPSIPNDRKDIIPRERFRMDQYSGLFELWYSLKHVPGLQLQLKVASDIGSFYSDNLGLMAGARWRLQQVVR